MYGCLMPWDELVSNPTMYFFFVACGPRKCIFPLEMVESGFQRSTVFPDSQKIASRCIRYSKLPLDVNVCVLGAML